MSLSVGKIFALALGIYFLAALVPGAIDSFFAADTGNWSTSAVALWAIIPLAIVAVVVLAFLPRFSKGE